MQAGTEAAPGYSISSAAVRQPGQSGRGQEAGFHLSFETAGLLLFTPASARLDLLNVQRGMGGRPP